MPFRDLVNQDHAVLLLRTAVRSSRVSYAYLFVGPRGVGRHRTAIAFAQLLNCERADGDACGQCRACTLIASGQHPDVRVVDVAGGRVLDPEDTTKTGIGIKQVLALRREVVYPPYQGRRDVYVLADASTRPDEAGNTPAQRPEEPPDPVLYS